MTPVMMPGMAWGSTTVFTACHRLPPRLSTTVRNSVGTERSASSAVLMTIGSVMIARVREPARIEVPKRRNSTNMPRPNRP